MEFGTQVAVVQAQFAILAGGMILALYGFAWVVSTIGAKQLAAALRMANEHRDNPVALSLIEQTTGVKVGKVAEVPREKYLTHEGGIGINFH